MKFTSLSLADVSRTQHVKRWHIVDMIKGQSVAEHSYMVALIAMKIMEESGMQDVLFQRNVIVLSLMHDATEGITGDVPSPIKKKVFGYGILEQRLDPITKAMRDRMDTTGVRIVKMADLIEAIHHLEKYGIRGRTRDHTLKALRARLSDVCVRMGGEGTPSGKSWADVASSVQLDLDCSRLTIVEEVCGA